MAYAQMRIDMPWSLVKSGFHKTPHFNSVTQKTAAGRGRSSISLMPNATWDFSLDLNAVLGGEAVAGSVLQDFLSCYMETCGASGFFLFTDPNDNTVSEDAGILLNVTPGAAGPMSRVGDGVSTQFQLARLIGRGVDILQNVDGFEVFVNGAPATVAISQTGVITFSSAPAADAILSWDGTFQYLCQFTEDTLKDLARVNLNANGFLWSCSSIEFESVFV